MRKFLLSLVMMISTLFAMADITNGGSVPFSSGRTETVYGCSGETFEISVTCLNGTFLQIQNDGSGFTLTDWSSTSSNGVSTYKLSGTFSSEAGTYPVTVYDEFDETSSMTLNFKVGTNMADPTITVSGVTNGSYIVGETYDLLANTTAEEVDWWVYPEGNGYEFVGERETQSTALKFTEAGDYTIRLNAYNNYGACTKSVDLSITVNAASSQQITYNAPNATLCKGSDMAYTVMASESIPSTTTLKMTVGLESFTGYSKGDSYVFDLSGMTPTSGTFNAEIVDVTNGTTIATPTITVNASPYVVISSTEQSFSTGTSYEFTATSDASNGTYEWSMGTYPNGGTYEFVNGYSSQSTTIKFNTAGQYELWCAVTDANGCSSNNFTYVTVEEGSSTPVTVTNGGSVTFVPGSSATLVGCVGEYPYVSFEGENLNLAQPQSGSGSGQANFSEGSYNSFTFELVSAGTYYFNIYPVGQENDVMVLNIQINEKPDVPTITSSDDTFLAGQTYTFTANTSSQDVTYEWTLSGLPYDGASIDGSNTEKTVSVVFNSALEPGQGTFTLYCEVTSNGCKALGQKGIEMSEGVTQGDDITYTAQPQVFCLYDGEYDTDFKVEVSGGEVPEGSTFHLTFGDYDIVTDRAYSTIYFELPDTLSAGTYDVTVWNADKTKQLCTSSLTVFSQGLEIIGSNEGVANTPLEFSVENPGSSDDVTYKWRVLYYGSEDPAESSDYTFSNGNEGSTINVTFLNAGDYYIACQREGQCASGESTHYVEVTAATQTAVCSINEKTYNTLYKALEAVESGDVILVLDDISEADSVITLNSSFTLNTNGHTINFGAIQGMASRTITGGGILNTALENSNTNGSDVLTIDGATLNLNGVQWMAKGMITLTNNASVTLTDGIFLGGGDDDGFNLSIDNTSSFNVNGKSIWGYNYERIASQMSPYLPSGYTVTGTSDGLEFSPDANVTLSVQSADPITYTAEAVTTCFNEWDEGEFVVTASDMVEGSYVMTFGTNELTTQRTDGDQIYFELKNIPAGTYNVTVWNSDKSKQLCTSTLTILDASLNVEGPEEGVTNEPLTFTVTNPVSGVTYEWVVEMYGGDSNSPADPSSYTADSFEGTTFTVTFLEADEYYRISCNSSCGYGTEMALDISEAPNYVKVIELPKSSYGENLWQINSSGATTLVQDAVTAAEVDDYTPQIGDVFSYTLKGVASFTGTVGFYLVDVSSAACYWAPFTDSTASYHENNQFQVTKGESFEISGELEITNLSWDNWRACGAVTLTNPSLDIEAHSADGLLEDEVVTLSLTEYSLTFTEAEIERTYHIYGKAIACNGETTTVQIAAPQGFANPSDIKITGQMGTITPTSVEDTLATFENVQAYWWSLKDGDESVFSFSVEDETITATITGPTTATVDEEVTYSVTASSTLPNAVLNYSWGGGVENSLESDLMAVGSFSTSDIGEAEVFCLVESENGCSYEATLSVTVEEPVETEFTISEKSTLSVCQGDAATVVITAEPAASFIVVSADNETIYTADNEDYVTLTPTMTTAGDYTYYIVEDVTQKKSFTITVNEKPTVTISATQSVVCVGDEVQLEAIMNLSDGSFFWGGADNFDDATSGNPKFVATYDGHYPIFCQVTGAGNCVGTAELSLQVYPTPTVTITGPAEAYVGDEVEYTATLSASNMPSTATFTYEWGGGVESFDTDTKAKGSFSESDIEEGAEVFCIVSTTDGTCADTATYPVVVKAKTEYTISGETTFCAGSKDFITITSEEPINTESFSIETSYNETVPFTINADDPNVAIIYHASLPTGGYSINIMENRQIVNSFQVQQNIGPQRVSFNCPEEGEAVVGGTWAVSAPQAENYIYYQWSSNGISFENVARQTITFDGEGDVWVVLAIEDENQCVGVSDTCRFTIDAGEQKYSAVYPDGEENFTWCHGENSGHVEFDITSNQEIPDGITLKNELGWISNLSVDNYGTSAHFSFSYPYAQNQNFEVIDAQGNTLLTVNGYGNPYIKADITGDTLVVFTSGGDNSLELGTEILEFWNGSYYSANASYIDWTYDDTNISAECLGWKNDDEGTCSQNEMKFTFSETGVYPISFKASSNGCWSDEASKYIYVVPFNPALFSLSPEKDTIELGGNGVQLTLLYEGEPYQGDYALNTYGHVYITETGNIVKAIDQTGTCEVFAEVDGFRVATALITVVEKPIEYTVANVSVCEGTDEAEAVIYASGSIEGKSVTVRDEDDNTFYPEYNDDNDAATVHLNYLSTGTYTYKVFENDVYKTEFTVKVNSLPTASIECPQNPVVGDTWTPNTAMAEGLTYHWWSEDISSLDGTTSCCPTVTFTEAGTFSATLVVKNNETGCLSEGATCTFDVGDKPQQYFLNCPDGDLSIKNEDYLMYVSAGDTEGKTLTWSTSDEEIVTLAPDTENGQCVVNFKQIGTAQINCQIAEATGEVLETVACTLNIVQPQYVEFSQHTIEVEKGDNTIVCLTAEGIDLSQATITFGSSNDEAFVVAPSDGLTGCAVVSGLEITEYTEQLTATVQYNEGSETKTFEASADVHVVEPFVCEGTKIVGGEFRDLPYANIEIGDKFRFKWIGTSNFTGMLHVQIWDLAVDTQTPETIIVSQSVAHQVYKGETYTFDDILEIQTVSESQSHNYKLYFSPMPMDCPTGYDENGDAVCYGVMCEQYYAIGKEETQECQQVAFEYSAADNNYIHSADGLAYEAEDGDKFNVSWTATSDFSGTINLALIDKSAGANYWQEVSSWASVKVTAGVPFSVDEVFTIDGLVSTSPEIALFATVNDQVDGASFCMSNFWFHKLGDIVQECTNYELDGENSVQLQYVYNGDKIAVGDTYNYEVFGTAQFTGDLFFSLVDQSEEVGYWDMLADSKVFSVVEGERFEIKGAFTVTKEPTSTSPEVYFTVGRIDANQSGEIKTICVLSSAIYKSNGGDECYNKIVVDGGNSAVLNRVSNYQVSVGEVYEYYVSGVADFTGEAMVSFADASKDADYYFALAEPVTFAVTEGESFSQRGTFVVKNQTPSEYPDFTLMIAKNNGVTGESSSFCIDGAYIEKQVLSYTMSESEVNMFVGGTKYIYLLGDGQPYSGYVEWGVTDLSGSTTPCVTVDDGEIIANSEGQAQIYAKVHDQVVATAMVSVTTFSCDGGELYTVSQNGATSYIVYPLTGIAAGDSYKVTINGKTDYDGVLATAVVDFSSVSEDDGPAQGSNLGEIMVKAGQEFSYNTILTVVSTDASAPEYKMIFLLGGSEELDEFKLCATQLSVEKFTAQYTIDGIYDSYMFVGETKQLTIKNIDGTVYGGNAQWISTDENVVAIGNDGYVYAKSEGVAEVQVIIGGDIVATTLINVERATGISIGLDKPGYEIANVGDEQTVYINAIGLQAATFTYQYDESIIEVTPIQGTNSLRVKGLKVGSTHLFVTATLNGESYEAGAVVEVGGGSTSNDYTLAFAQSKYEITEGESIRACLTIGEGFKHFNPQFNFDQTVISIADPTDNSNCGVITGLKAGQTFVEVIAEAPDGKFYSAQTEVIVNAKSTQDDYKLAFEQENYEVVEGETIESCLILGNAFEHGFQPTVTYDETIINVREPDATQTNNCATVTGLKAGMTVVTIDVEKDGVHYTAKTHVVVTVKPLPYFVQQSMDLKVGESDQVVVMSQDGGPAQASLFTYESSDSVIAKVNTSGLVEAVGVGNVEVSVFFENALVGKVIVAVEAAPQMPTPSYTNTNTMVMCFDKSASTEGGISLDRMVSSTNNGVLRWYDASGKALTAAPMVSSAKAGKVVYYVSQVGTGEFVNYRESEKIPFTVEVVYVAEPKLNVTDQSTCQGATMIPFVATSASDNTIEWMDATGAVVAQGSEFTPQVEASGYYTYKVTAKDAAGCVSAPMTVTYAVGSAVKPEIFAATQAESYVVGEPVTLGTSNQISDEYSVVWTLGDNEYVHGTSFTTKFEEVGTYTVTCKVVETNTGCADSASKVITVEEKVIPLQSIVVEPETVTLYEGEQGYVSLAFEPSYASNMAYSIELADSSVAYVAGLTVWGLSEGTTKATVKSAENPDVKTEFNIVVNKLIQAQKISMPNIITLALNEETKIAASVIPAEASYNQVAFKEKTDNVISIDAEGKIKALGEGTSTIVAYSNGGLQATAVVYVTAAQTAITDIAVPDEIELKLRDSVVVSYKVTPVTLAAKLLEWAIEDNNIATFSNGVVKAVSAGETNLTVSIGNISKTIKITVTTSSAPIIGTAPKIAFEQGTSAKVDFSDFVSDDETELANLTFEVSSDDLNVSIDGTVATVTAKSDSYKGTTSFTLSVTDGDNLVTSADIPVEVTEIANKAPIILIEDVQIKYNACTYLNLSEIASDDFTSYKKLIFKFEAENVTLDVIRSRKYQLRMYTDDPDMEFDTLFVTVTDDAGLSTSAKIIMYVNSLPNRAPKISEIPVQTETDDAAFGTIELANYVKDDYTAASSIKWTTSSSDNLSVTIDEGVASVEVLNAFWNGAEAITFYAADEEGLKDSTIVYYSRKVTINEETVSSGSEDELTPVVWEGAPVVNIMAMKFIGVPGEQFIIMASLSGYDCTWAWEIEGANGIDQTSLMQMVSFDKPGTYTVKLTVQSADGQHSIEVVKENLLTVVGINERTPAICKGDAVTLTATEGLDSYYWTTGDVKNTTTARPEATTLYKLTMKKGMFTLVDTVTVKVSVPVALMEDSVMCAGTTFDLEAIGDYVSYAWNTGDVEKAITIPSEVASYTVTAVDGMQCVSVDTFNLTKVNELPAIDLGEDQTPCDGTTVTLDAGTGYEYLWSTGATSQTIDLTANTETVWARIIDANKCINYDTVVVAFTYPYPEQIGVATFSETTNHIILAWEKTAGVNTVSYAIERETGVTGNWEQVGDDVMFSESGIVVDEDVNYKETAFKYRLVTTDACGNKAYSEPHRSMVSSTMWQTNGLQTIHWTAYKPFANVTQYKILRGYEATQMDTVIDIPASDDEYFIWNETDPQYTDDINVKYRVVFRLKSEVNENAVNTLDGQPVEGYYTKAESGPFSLAMSNIAEVETDVSVSEIAFPADVVVYPTTISSYINVAIASPEDNNFIVEVLNANGQVVARVQTGEISKTLLQISAEGLRQGVYTVRISDGQQSTSVKVVK